MPRRYHSPSSTELGRRCLRAWSYCYVDGLRDPDVPWREEMAGKLPPGVTPRQRSSALGGAAHSVIEAWYRGEAADWLTYPGQVAESGRHLLPQPDAVLAFVETPIGEEPIAPVEWPGSALDKGPRVGLRVDGVLWAGFRDLVAHGGAELARLRIDAPAGVALFDHKTTASIGRYAKDAAALATDLQCNLYALATMVEFDAPSLPVRWVYYETKKVRRALPVDATIERSQATDVVGKAGELTRTLDAIERSVDAPQNLNACGDYGGCPYHVSAGGPCNAHRPIGKLIALQFGKGKSMALTDEQKAKFAQFRKTTPAAETPSEAPESGEVAVAPTGQLALPGTGVNGANGASANAPRPRGRPRKQPIAVRPAVALPPPQSRPGGLADIVGKAQTEIAAAEHEIAAATTRRDAAVVALKAALG